MKILAAVLLTAALTASGTEAARHLITSADIKDGTIQATDLNAATKRALRPRLSYPFVNRIVLPNETEAITVNCKKRERLVSGGFATPASPTLSELTVLESRPAHNGWRLIARNKTDTFATATVFAVCSG